MNVRRELHAKKTNEHFTTDKRKTKSFFELVVGHCNIAAVPTHTTISIDENSNNNNSCCYLTNNSMLKIDIHKWRGMEKDEGTTTKV